MIFELEKSNFNKVNILFSDLEYCLSISSVTNGINPGRVFADDLGNARSAMIISPEGMYLGGDHKNDEFNRGINDILKNVIFKNYKEGGKPCYTLFYPSSEWDSSIKSMFDSLYPMKDARYYLELNTDEFQASSYSENIVKIDSKVLNSNELDELDDIKKSILEAWGTFDNFLENGFGYLYIIDNKIVSMCLSDCVVQDRCEIGIETHEDYRRKGYALEVVTAALNYCKSSGIKKAGWHCWIDNTASYKLAQKAGFKILMSIDVYFGWYDLTANCLINGNHNIRKNKNYALAAEFYSKAFERNYGYAWQYFNAACAYLKIGKNDSALKCYKASLDKGWKSLDDARRTWFYEYLYQEEDVCDVEGKLKMLSETGLI